MQDLERLEKIRERLDDKGIYDVRQIVRALQMRSDSPKKQKMIELVLLFAQGIVEPQVPSTRGAPPKSDKYDEDLVAEIRDYRSLCVFGADSAESLNVSDSGAPQCSELPACGVLYKTDGGYFINPDAPVEVAESFITRYSLLVGDKLSGVRKAGEGMLFVDSVNGVPSHKIKSRRDFLKLTRVYPRERLRLEGDTALRMLDMFAPLALGQRVFIVSEEDAGKTTLLKKLLAGVAQADENIEICLLLLNCRPEEASDFGNGYQNATVFVNTFDTPLGVQLNTARLAFEYCKRQAETGKDAVLFADGLFTDGFKSEILKQFLFCAGNSAESGSITLIAGLPRGFEEYKQIIPTANSVISLSSELARSRVFPAIDAKSTYAERDESLLTEDELKTADILRGSLTSREIVELFKNTTSNREIIDKYKNG